jgi:hypothetical protein
MITLISMEIKRYVAEYRRIAASLAVAVIVGLALWGAAGALERRGYLFEPFTVGVVDNDGAAELRFVFDFLHEAVTDMAFLSETEAAERMRGGTLPAYAALPNNFTEDIFRGRNAPFTLHVHRGFPLQSGMVRLMATGGIAYISVSQAGVYATLDEAEALGIPSADINNFLVIPVNAAYMMNLIEFKNLFTHETLNLTGDVSVGEFYLRRFAAFWTTLTLLTFARALTGYTPGITARLTLAGLAVWKIQIMRIMGFLVVQLALCFPLYFILGVAVGFAWALFLTAFGLLAAALFKRETGFGLFVFFSALVMWLMSGGVAPPAFLPQGLWGMGAWSPVHWAAEGYTLYLILTAFAGLTGVTAHALCVRMSARSV